MDFNQKLSNYAELIVKIGVNVQSGQPVILSCPVEYPEFARLIAKKAYESGASEVILNWKDDELTHLKYKNAPLSVFEDYPQWEVEKSKYYFEKNCAIINVYAEDPELLKDIDTEKIIAAQKSSSVTQKENRKYTMNDIVSWCVVSIPTKGWAKRVFPNISEEEAVEKLWELIFHTTRSDLENPIKEWENHVNNMDSHAKFLNEKQFKYLHYTNSLGTDLMVELPKNHIWVSAGSKNAQGVIFIANIPTEEVFTMPKKDGVNGVLYST